MDVSIAYFSGTGCTALCARELERAIGQSLHAGDEVRIVRMVMQEGRIGFEGNDRPFARACEFPPCDILILAFPVHGFDAPAVVHEFLNGLPPKSAMRAAVISVSGGGEMFPNRAARSRAIETLEAKSIPVFHEEMLCMPCSVIAPTPPRVAQALLAALPSKCDTLAKRLVENEFRRTKPPKLDAKIAHAGLLSGNPKMRTGFARGISVSDACVSCGNCAAACPCANVSMRDGRPAFGDTCAMCFGCIYACPQSALYPRTGSFLMLKGGFSLTDMQTSMSEAEKHEGRDAPSADPNHKKGADVECVPLADEPRSYLDDIRGPLWKGVRNYLSEL